MSLMAKPMQSALFRHALHARHFSAAAKILSVDNMNQNLRHAEYAVRGELVLKANNYESLIAAGKADDLPFDEIVYCNIGNPHSVGQVPLSFARQVIALTVNPELLSQPDEQLLTLFPADAIARARNVIKSTGGGLGAYSHSKGVALFREDIAKFIQDRDGFPSDPENIFLCNGASAGIELLLKMLIRGPKDGILIPIPQYPLYSATVTCLEGAQVPYFLDEATGWGMTVDNLEGSVAQARAEGINVRAMVVINPGNPTGACLSESNMQDVVNFCEREGLVLMADEVYQSNVYQPELPFVSFKKVVSEIGSSVQLASFHSTSKGMLGECGLRGGYAEYCNMSEDILDQIYKIASISLCPNLVGQLMCSLMVNPPKPGDESYSLFQEQFSTQKESLVKKAGILAAELDSLPGMSCDPISGAMYAFPKVVLSPKAVEAAQAEGKNADTMYCLAMLDATGVCVVPGSGFGQAEGTFHFRTTFLPPMEKMMGALEKIKAFHLDFMSKYS